MKQGAGLVGFDAEVRKYLIATRLASGLGL